MKKDNKKDSNKAGVEFSGINWYPGHMAKTKREIKEKIDLIDIVFEVIDARIPYSSKNNDIDNIVGDKPRILIMSKYDLCDKVETDKWIKYYEGKGYIVIPLDLTNSINSNVIMNKIKSVIDSVNEKRIKKGLKPRRTRVVVLGIPNAGKSTLINRLVGKKATSVGNRPGVTKNLEWIRINDKLELLDTPGILWPRLDDNIVAHNLASMTAIKEEILEKDDIAIYIINKMLELYEDNITSRYDIKTKDDIVITLEEIGKKIGAFRNGETDYERVYLKVIKDFQDGYLGKVTFDRI